MRHLVSVQRIKEILPIEGADRIEMARVLGWQCVVKKGEFKPGDLCFYAEIDTFFPILPELEFLRASSYKKTEYQGEGLRIKTQKLRGCISQGLILDLNIRESIGTKYAEWPDLTDGVDVTKCFGAKEYFVPETTGALGTAKSGLPNFVYHTDETRIQSAPDVLNELMGKPYYITTKIDGTSVSFFVKDGKFGITGHNTTFTNLDDSFYYKFAESHGIVQAMLNFGKNIVVQGEFAGPSIQSNRLKLPDFQWFVFNIKFIDENRFANFDELVKISKSLGLTMVPIDEEGESFNYTEDELLAKADGQYSSGTKREGIVIRPKTETWSKTLNGRLSFKVINNKYLLKNNL